MARTKKKQQVQFHTVADGVTLLTAEVGAKENRRWTLLLKGLVVFLIIGGMAGCFLTSIQVDCNYWVIFSLMFVASLVSAQLYYSKTTRTLGYLGVLVLMIFLFVRLRRYLNSGLFGVLNDVSDEIATFFDSNAMSTYAEQISNHRLAVTIAVAYIGCLACIFGNITVSTKMRNLGMLLLSFGLLFFPMYLNTVPNLAFVVMLVGGIICSTSLLAGGHMTLTFSNQNYEYKPKQKHVSYVYARKATLMNLVVALLVSVLVLAPFTALYPSKVYYGKMKPTALKENTFDLVENMSILGMYSMFNMYQSTAGLTNGRLGGINMVTLDYEPDLNVVFTPYTFERVYFKTFAGATYLPYENKWERALDSEGKKLVEEDQTALALSKLYGVAKEEMEEAEREASNENVSRAIFRITNVAAATGAYVPYYSLDEEVIYPGKEFEYTAYPVLENTSLGDYELEEYQKSIYLFVPEDNEEAIRNFCEEAGLTKDMSAEEITVRMADYFQENYPYTYRPGATKWGNDFVNYFLLKNKKGYCAHFASTATLVYRYLGIPARYIEGYAMDFADVEEEGTILYEEDAAYYFDGTNPLGDVAAVSVNLTDATAHAWVEIYDTKMGWSVRDITPSSQEVANISFWSRLSALMQGSDTGATSGDVSTEELAETVTDTTTIWTGRVMFIVLLVAILVVAILWGKNWIQKRIAYRKAGLNDKLIMMYTSYIRRKERKYSALKKMHNYRQQLCYLRECKAIICEDEMLEELITIVQKAGFAPDAITMEEFEDFTKAIK